LESALEVRDVSGVEDGVLHDALVQQRSRSIRIPRIFAIEVVPEETMCSVGEVDAKSALVVAIVIFEEARHCNEGNRHRKSEEREREKESIIERRRKGRREGIVEVRGSS